MTLRLTPNAELRSGKSGDDAPMTTFAQKLWQDVLRGVGAPQMAVRTFLSGVATADIDRQMASIPPAMIQELREFIPIGQPGWDEQLLITGTHEHPGHTERERSQPPNRGDDPGGSQEHASLIAIRHAVAHGADVGFADLSLFKLKSRID